MYENTRKHYRVAKKEIYEDPCEGIYVTKEEQKKCFLITIAMIALSFLAIFPIAFKNK